MTIGPITGDPIADGILKAVALLFVAYAAGQILFAGCIFMFVLAMKWRDRD